MRISKCADVQMSKIPTFAPFAYLHISILAH
jgi:hypothetical protein